nr:heterochromatin protein 1-like [Pocillopora verrucosa]
MASGVRDSSKNSRVERLISRRTSHGTVQYLVKWKGYSAFHNSWEDEDNLTTDLIRTYDKPIVDKERLTRNVDNLRLSVLFKLRRREGREKGYTLLDKDDFNKCDLPENWDRVIDCNGDGVRVKYPFKIRLFLAKSPKTYSIINGKIQEDQRMLIEKLSIDFSRQPVTIQS